jgi:hypothetical protein
MLLPALTLLERASGFLPAPLAATSPPSSALGGGDAGYDASDVPVYKAILVLASASFSLVLAHALAMTRWRQWEVRAVVGDVDVALLLLALLALLAHRAVQVQALLDRL